MSSAEEPPASPFYSSRRKQRGLTLVELIVAFTILALLSTMALPLTAYKIKREKEKQLREALVEMRAAIDKYKDAADQGKLGTQKLDSDNYPESLDVLVEGVKLSGAVDKKVHFLRRIPKDPMTNSFDWGKRSTRDDTTSQSWGGQNVFNVYTKSTEKARDGTPYSEW
ncbi:MAG TPA: type II secretion system protein [Bryobacteraceae bacterium]|nr:type II secretion system protein [Bryobacteraceae bacterium]